MCHIWIDEAYPLGTRLKLHVSEDLTVSLSVALNRKCEPTVLRVVL